LAQLSLRQLLKYYEERPLTVIPKFPEINHSIEIEECLDLAFQNRPDLLLSKLNVVIAQYEKEIVHGETGFKISVDGSYGYRAEAFDTEDLDYEDEFFVGLSGSIPFWHHVVESNTIVQDTVPSAGQTTSTDFRSQTITLNLFSNTGKASRLEAKIAFKQAIEGLRKIKRTTLFEIGEAHFGYQKSIKQIEVSKMTKRLRQKEVDFMSIQVGLNEAPLPQLLESFSRRTDAGIEHNNAQLNYATALGQLDNVIGTRKYLGSEKN